MITAESVAQSRAELFDSVRPLLDERTLHILRRREGGALVTRRGWLVRRMMALADVIGLTVAFVFSLLVFAGEGQANTVSNATEILIFLLTVPLWLAAARLYGLYDSDEERTDHSTADDLLGVFHLVTVGSWVFFIAAELSGLPIRRSSVRSLLALRRRARDQCPRLARAFCRRTVAYLQNTVIVGAGDVGQLVAHKFSQHPEYGINLLGFVDAEPEERRDPGSRAGGFSARPTSFPSWSSVLDVERVVFAFSEDSHEELLDLIRSIKDLGVQIDIVPRLFEVLGPNVGSIREGLPLMGLPPLRLSRSTKLLEASARPRVLAPVPSYRSCRCSRSSRSSIKLDSPGPVFFRQVRRWAPTRRSSGSSSSGRCPPTPSSASRRSPPSTSTSRRAAIRGCSRSPTILASPGSGGTCAGTRSTSCRSCSTSS